MLAAFNEHLLTSSSKNLSTKQAHNTNLERYVKVSECIYMNRCALV